jgi:hypothetical protein
VSKPSPKNPTRITVNHRLTPPFVKTTKRVLEKARFSEDGTLYALANAPPHMGLHVVREQLPRALRIMEAILKSMRG